MVETLLLLCVNYIRRAALLRGPHRSTRGHGEGGPRGRLRRGRPPRPLRYRTFSFFFNLVIRRERGNKRQQWLFHFPLLSLVFLAHISSNLESGGGA